MAAEFGRAALQVAVAQICQHFGWTSTQSIPLAVLTDLTERYINEVGHIVRRFAEHCTY